MTTRVPLPRTFWAFRNRSYRFLWPANFIAYASRWMQMTLLGWFVLVETDSPWLVGLVGFFGMIPMFVLGVLGGVLADAVDRRRLLLTTQAAALLSLVSLSTLMVLDLAVYWHAYPAILVMGIAWALDMPSRRSLIHDLLGRRRVTNGVALDSMGMSASMMIGPATAGVLIDRVGVTGGYLVVTILSLTSILLLSRLGTGQARPPQYDVGIIRNLADGLRYVAGHSALRAMVLITVLANLLLFPYMHMVPVMAREVLEVGPTLMGLLQAAPGIGSFAGAVGIASLTRLTHHGRVMLAGTLTAFAALLIFSQSTVYAFSLPTLLVMGIGQSGFGSMQAAMTMLLAPKEMRGKALGVVSLAIGSGPFGALIVSSIANEYGPAPAIAAIAIAGMASVGLVGISMPAIRARIA